MADIAKLTKEDILSKTFEVEYKGYKVEEVDHFLDQIVEDYTYFYKNMLDLKNEIQQLKQDIKKIQEQNENLIASLQLTKKQQEQLVSQNTPMIELVKRLSAVEAKNK